MNTNWKDANPKTPFGSAKPGLSDVPLSALWAWARVQTAGRKKYGHYNWREAGVTDTVYLDAMMRHILAWWDGEELDPDDGEPHLAHVMACAAILIDAKVHGKLNEVRNVPEVLGPPPVAPVSVSVSMPLISSPLTSSPQFGYEEGTWIERIME